MCLSRPHRPRHRRGHSFYRSAYLRASLGQPLRLHPASVPAGLAAGAGPAALPCSYPLPRGCMASRCVKGKGYARHPHPFPTPCSGLRPPVPPLTPLPARTTTRMPNCAIDSADDGSRGWCGPQPYGRGHGPLTRQECPHAAPGGGVQGHRPVTPAPEVPPARVESPERQSLFGKCPSRMAANIAVNRENLLIATKTRQFLRETFLPAFSTKHQKNPTPCKIALPKARGTTMAEMGSHETGLSKTISGAERDRRVAAVNYARASVGLEGFSLSAADEEHAQRFIDGDIDLEEFVQPRSAMARPKA